MGQPGAWRVIAVKDWRRKEHIMPREREAGVWTARSLSRLTGANGRRHLIFSDTMEWVCAASKRKIFHLVSVSPLSSQLVQMRRSFFRWIPSEVNPPDAPSRRFDTSSLRFGAFIALSMAGQSPT